MQGYKPRLRPQTRRIVWLFCGLFFVLASALLFTCGGGDVDELAPYGEHPGADS